MRAPGRLARFVVWTATSALPAGAVRERYRLEMVSELYGQSSLRRALLVVGLVLSVWSLRTVVVEADPVARPRRALGCRTNLRHRWRTQRTDDGERYRRCRRCGKDDDGLISSASPAVQWTNVY